MRIDIERFCIKIYPETAMDKAFLEDTLLMTEDRKQIILERTDDENGNYYLFSRRLYMKNPEFILKEK